MALANVNLEIPARRVSGAMGPAVGQIHPANLLAGIDRSTEGQVNVLGTDLARLNEASLPFGGTARRIHFSDVQSYSRLDGV